MGPWYWMDWFWVNVSLWRHGEKCLGQIDYVVCVSQNYNDSWVFLTQGWRSSLRQTKVWYSGKVLLCVTKDCNCWAAGCLRPIDAAGALLVSWTQRERVSASFSTLALRGTIPLPEYKSYVRRREPRQEDPRRDMQSCGSRHPVIVLCYKFW